MSHQLISI